MCVGRVQRGEAEIVKGRINGCGALRRVLGFGTIDAPRLDEIYSRGRKRGILRSGNF